MSRYDSSDYDSDSSSGSEDDISDFDDDEDDNKGFTAKRKRASRSTYMQKRPRRDSPGVYALRNTRTGICYVGKSNNVPNRILQHRSENRPDVLNRESLSTTGSVNDLESWERNEVLTRMFTEGMDSVRGWRYTSRGQLTMDDKNAARDDIVEKFDLCRRCGRDGHFVSSCFARSPAFWCRELPFE